MSAALMTEPNTGHSPHTSTQPGGRLVTPDGAELPLRHASVSAEARGGIARVVLTQRFLNPHDQPLLVKYLLPMPSDGAVSGFCFHIGDKRVVGEIDRKVQARQRFEQAIAAGHTAALLEQDRSSLFTQEVGNIPPHTEIVAEIIVDQRLRWLEEGSWEWRFPTVVGPRYMGQVGRVSDAQKIAVDISESRGKLPAQMSLSLVISDDLSTEGAVESPSHHLELNPQEEEGLEVVFRGDSGVALDRDVVVRWQVADQDVGLALSLARPADIGHEGSAYGLLTILPPSRSHRREPLSRDLIFLIDTSGSMSGRPLKQAVRIASAMIDTLGPKDQIELISFGWEPRRWRKEPVLATRDGKRAAIKWLRKLRASGGTQMHRGIIEALRPLRSNAQRQVVLVTDGLIGFEQEIIATVLDKLPPNCRLHTIGVGSAPNRSLTGPAARAGRGVELVVGLEEDAERVSKRLLARTTSPLVTEVTIEGDGLRSTAPSRIPDLFAGAPVLVSLELDPQGGPIQVRGLMAADDSEQEGSYRQGDPSASVFVQQIATEQTTLGQGDQGITALFGRERVEDLETQIAAGGEARDLDAEIEGVGLTFQISTRLTSWVALTEEVTVDPDEQLREVRQPHELPYGTSIEGLGLRQPTPETLLSPDDFSLRQPTPGAPPPPPAPCRPELPRAAAGPPSRPASPASRPSAPMGAGPAGPPLPASPAPPASRPSAPMGAGPAGPPLPVSPAPLKRRMTLPQGRKELKAEGDFIAEGEPMEIDSDEMRDEPTIPKMQISDSLLHVPTPQFGAAQPPQPAGPSQPAPVSQTRASIGDGLREDERGEVLKSAGPTMGPPTFMAQEQEVSVRKSKAPHAFLMVLIILAIFVAIVTALWFGFRGCAGSEPAGAETEKVLSSDRIKGVTPQ